MTSHFKQPKAKPNPAYLAAVRELPCVICQAFGEMQTSPTTAHHPIHGRFGFRKRPDETAIPLCDGHHQGTFDKSKIAVHREPDLWKSTYGQDTDYIAPTQDLLASLLPAAPVPPNHAADSPEALSPMSPGAINEEER